MLQTCANKHVGLLTVPPPPPPPFPSRADCICMCCSEHVAALLRPLRSGEQDVMDFLKEMKIEATQSMHDECKKLVKATVKATAPKKSSCAKLASTSATADQPWLLANKHIKYEYHPRDEGEDDDSDEDVEREREPIELGEGGYRRGLSRAHTLAGVWRSKR